MQRAFYSVSGRTQERLLSSMISDSSQVIGSVLLSKYLRFLSDCDLCMFATNDINIHLHLCLLCFSESSGNTLWH